jgi:TonB family protein
MTPRKLFPPKTLLHNQLRPNAAKVTYPQRRWQRRCICPMVIPPRRMKVIANRTRRALAVALYLFLGVGAFTIVLSPRPAFAQEELSRKVKSKVPPLYPEIARRMNIAGTVKVSVVVTPSGTVRSTKVLGGHPLLVTAAMDALKKWKFEPASDESTGVVEFKFEPQN